ncbi:MAG: HAMP domain-containing sensor histidine kinase, partial [Bacteroidota bacterium]|nr:HAMP domain-containing sensor histidine kinase [Bacteroidota bacterium]
GIKKQEHLLRILLIIFIGSIIFIYFTGMLFARKVFQPVGHILKNVKRISATNLKLRLTEPSSNDELTELIKLLNEMLDRLEHSFDMQKHFISNASHELKNPLTAIIGETEITLSKKRSVEEYELSLGKIAAEAERLDLLTKNLLSLAQVDFDLSKIVWKPIRVDELLWEVKDYFEKTDHKGRIIVHIESLPENPQFLTIYGNENLLSIALTNIIDNACKFSGDKPVDITFSANGTLIFLSITDKGIGIPAKELNEISEPFFRASNALSFRGSGIGLSLAYKIIKLHRGTIEFNSVHGKGTEVLITFLHEDSHSY